MIGAKGRKWGREAEMAPKHLALLAALVALGAAQAAAQPAGDLFHGKEMSVLIGGAPGGGADIYARELARFYGRFLPGTPSVVAKNVLGAGGLKLANQIYNVSPKDGTEIATFLTSTALDPLFGNKEARYETTKFTWIGNMDSDATGCVTWRTSGIKSWQDLKGRTRNFGASGPASTASIQAKIVAALLGIEIKMIHGYTDGMRSQLLAMQRGELDAICGLYLSTLHAQFAGDVAKGELLVWMTFGKSRAEDFPEVPTVYEVLKSEADRQLADLIFGQDLLSRPFSAPPGLAPERIAALRQGFMATMKDPTFLAETSKAGLSIRPMDGEETQARYASFYAMPKAVVERAMSLIGGRGEKEN
jgi:tripartite-type tricarboxylate transporter receptor subunit TctC